MIGITYQHVPPAVVLVQPLTWHEGSSPTGMPPENWSFEDHAAHVDCAPGVEIVVAFSRKDGAYLLDGPFVCPVGGGERPLDAIWRRTIHGRALPQVGGHSDLSWVAAIRDFADGWPRCAWTETTAECWGVPLDARGALAFVDGDRVWWTVVAGGAAVADFQQSAWARLILVRGAEEREPLVAKIAHPVTPAERRASLRLDTAPVPNAHAVSIAAGAVWVFGEQIPHTSWIDLSASGAAPAYLPLEEVAHAPPGLPFWTTLEAPRVLDGSARSPQGPAAGAIVTLFRLLEPPAIVGDGRQQPRRVFAAEKAADGAGEFRFDALGDADYEVVAWHPQFGRGIAAVARSDTSVTVRLASSGLVRGRVIANGKPLPGVDVVSLPDLGAYARAADLTDVKGGDARTGPDGRFAVSVASGGGGEVRVGGGGRPIRRFPLPRDPLPIVDLGDIDLGGPIHVTVVLDGDPGCDIRATGPIGRPGLQVIAGNRTGPGLFKVAFPEEGMWEVHLLCGRDERALAPSVVSITQANSEREVRLMVR